MSSYLCAVLAGCVSLALADTTGVSTLKKPHVIFMVIDDLGWNDVGWHDQFQQIHTPKLNELVNESIKLSQYYVYRFCSPSRSTFMTGRYPWHIGQHTEMNLNPTPGIACGINLEYDFMPKVLKKAGYTTWALGKWHLGFHTSAYTPTGRGFDRYLGYYSGAEEHFSHLKKGVGYEAYDLTNNSGTELRPALQHVGNASATYSSYLYGNETLRLLDEHDPNTPLYVYLAWNNVHDPNEAPQNYIDAHANIKDGPRRNLTAMMSAIDDQLTDVIAKLKEKKMWDDTLLVITTDNGGNLGGSGCNYPLRGGKYTFWQGGVRAVGVVGGGKNVIPDHRRGTSWDGAMHAADWYTTIAALAGVSTDKTGPVGADGVNVFAELIGNQASPRREVVLQVMTDSPENENEASAAELQQYCDGNPWDQPLCEPPQHPATTLQVGSANLKLGALIQHPWKVIYGYPGWQEKWDGWIQPPAMGNAWQSQHLGVQHYNGSLCVAHPCLFNIEKDPYEHKDVAGQHPAMVSKMVARLQELAKQEVTLKKSGLCPEWTGAGSKPDPRCNAKARELGFWEPWLEQPSNANEKQLLV